MATTEIDIPAEPVVGTPASKVDVNAQPLTWETPGALMARGVAGLEPVRFVLERVAPDRYLVFVILDSDDEATLDRIFEVESMLYGRFRKMPFDVRVMRPPEEWTADDLLATSVCRYARR